MCATDDGHWDSHDRHSIVNQREKQQHRQQQNKTNEQQAAVLTSRNWYEREAWVAVNQAAGRVIRHRSDYGVCILLDCRFLEEIKRVQRNARGPTSTGYAVRPCYLSPYLHDSLQAYPNFDDAISELRRFFAVNRGSRHDEPTIVDVQLNAEAKLHVPTVSLSNTREKKTLSVVDAAAAKNVAHRKVTAKRNVGGVGCDNFSVTTALNNFPQSNAVAAAVSRLAVEKPAKCSSGWSKAMQEADSQKCLEWARVTVNQNFTVGRDRFCGVVGRLTNEKSISDAKLITPTIINAHRSEITVKENAVVATAVEPKDQLQNSSPIANNKFDTHGSDISCTKGKHLLQQPEIVTPISAEVMCSKPAKSCRLTTSVCLVGESSKPSSWLTRLWNSMKKSIPA